MTDDLDEATRARMLDAFDGYDWGDPIRLWTVDGPEACLAPVRAVPRREYGLCPRCGCDGGRRVHILCRDCRDVLAKTEWEAWAA